ncbi:AAA family ATPase [Naasia aerilata]|nr:AAA family ATPase [Naasia aerilata]
MARAAWPATVPAVRRLLDEGLDLGPVTVLVGENGSGKSTIVEAIAMAFGLSGEGGSSSAVYATRPSESPLHDSLQLVRGAGGARRGFFLRAETMHGLYTYLDTVWGNSGLHDLSHGESFLELVRTRFRDRGLWVLDEPEAALSFSGTLALLVALNELVAEGGSQVILSTHSPILAAMDGATILELGEWGIRESTWEDLELVRSWRSFLAAPERFLRHLRP